MMIHPRGGHRWNTRDGYSHEVIGGGRSPCETAHIGVERGIQPVIVRQLRPAVVAGGEMGAQSYILGTGERSLPELRQ
jgi:hypothetical protein